MVRQLWGKTVVYSEMKFEEYERLKAEHEKNPILAWLSLEELVEDMKSFYHLKENSREALEKLKKKQ